MVDIDRQIDAVQRTVRGDERDGEPTRVQKLSQTYPSPIEDVWDAVTTPERIARWFAPIEGDPLSSGHYQVVGNAGGTVEECRPPADGAAGYRITWEFGGGMSWVEVTLASVAEDETRLDLVHIARTANLPPGFWELYGPGATGVGWDSGLLGLSLHLASDASIPPGEGDAWMLSDEGKRFARRAADAWGDAQIADGGEPDAARAAAHQTYLFYTGQG
ncbi:SRPBCC domain-containing protein [Microbacterium aoyamense]|uniref:SRPBCC domain-containing protein n=1 Tax=Microbacterium aoyamense TaxID=344166 RepID=A0ABP5AKT1_9MICO|nr:SRPBCC domain-containing protein [Microbacterium aoyamense]